MDLIGFPKHKKKKNGLLTRVSSSKVDGHRPARFLWFYQWLSVALINVSAENLSRFSAVCWLFGRYLHKSLKYPIGLVESCYGGTPVEAWSSSRVLQQCGLEHSMWGEEEVVVVNSSGCLPGLPNRRFHIAEHAERVYRETNLRHLSSTEFFFS